MLLLLVCMAVACASMLLLASWTLQDSTLHITGTESAAAILKAVCTVTPSILHVDMLLLPLLLLLPPGWSAAGSAQLAGVLCPPEGHAAGSTGSVQLCTCAESKCQRQGEICAACCWVIHSFTDWPAGACWLCWFVCVLFTLKAEAGRWLELLLPRRTHATSMLHCGYQVVGLACCACIVMTDLRIFRVLTPCILGMGVC
jgi:hypothetical protein